MTNRLIVLPPSHYCERARWGLEYMAIPFIEERWPIGPHVGMAKAVAPTSSLPILVTPERTIQGSGEILDWTGMAGGDAETEARLADGIAVSARQFVYAATLHDPKAGVRAILFDGVSGPRAWLGRAMWPATRRMMAARMQASPDRLPAIAAAIDADLDWFETRRAGRAHLVRGAFGRADLTAASLMSIFIRRGKRGPTLALPPEAMAHMARWMRHPAVRWVQRTYAEFREGGEKGIEHDHADTTLSSLSRRQAPLE